MPLPNTWVTGQTFTAADADAVADAVNANTVAVAAAYTKPGGGIPSTDMTAAVQTSLGLANTALQSGAASLTATAVKTSAYTAAANDLIPADATSAGFTVTLPTAPADKSRIVVKKIDASINIVTIAAGGSDVFNVAGGSTSLTLLKRYQAVQLQYTASSAIWYVISTDAPVIVGATAIAYAATVTPNADTTAVANIGTLTGAITIANPTGAPQDGQKLEFRFTQDATGGRVITWGAAYAFGTDVTAALIPTTANANWEQVFEWHAGTSKWRALAITRGF